MGEAFQEKISKEISAVTKKTPPEEDPAQNSAVVAKVAKTSKICLKAMFTLFKVGQDKLPKCCGETCKFLHFAKREEVPVPTLETQLNGLYKKWFSTQDMKALISRAKRSSK